MKLFFATITCCILLTSCIGQTKNIKSKAKNTPKVAKMLATYHKQEHRLAFNGCEMTYNEKPFKLGMNIEELVKVFGSYDYSHKMFLTWKNAGVSISKDAITNLVNGIYIYMNAPRWFNDEESSKNFPYMTNYKRDYFLLEGMPIDKNMRVMDFIANSNFELNDFGVSNYGYELDYNCNGKKIGYYLDADGLWLRKGVGHLTFKDKPNPENKYPFQMLSIGKIKE